VDARELFVEEVNLWISEISVKERVNTWVEQRVWRYELFGLKINDKEPISL
jgi:hypothetical protein